MIYKNRNILLFIFLFVTSSFLGQIKIHKHLTQEEGLVQGQVSAILQDSKGYMWFGTYDGVSKWDGKHFENIQTHNGLLSSAVLSIKEGLDGKIYIGCYTGGILIYDNGKLDTLNQNNGLISNEILNITMFPNGEFLFSAIGNKITKYKNGQLSDWGKEVNYPNEVNYTIRDSYFDNDGTLYLATQQGLLVYKNNSFKIITTKDGLNHNLLFGINGDGKGTIYTASYKGINKIKNGVITKFTTLPLFKNSYTHKIYITKKGTFYAASDDGILKVENNIEEAFTTQNGLGFNSCYSVMEDNNGTIYFGTNGNGVSIYNPNERIINYNKNTGLPNESIWSILKSNDSTMYFGSVDGLIIKGKKGTKILNKQNGLVGNFIRVLKQTQNGKILVGTNSGLSVLENNGIKNFPLKNNFGVTQIYSILESDSGEVYLGTQTGLVIMQNGNVIKKDLSEKIRKQMTKELGGEVILSLSKTKDGSLVIGSMTGLTIYSKDKFIFFTTKNGLVDNSVNTTHVRSNGSIFIGTLKGLNIIRNNSVVDTIDVNDGLSNNSIADIEEDTLTSFGKDSGRIFVATYNGLNILTNINDSLSITKLYKKDGLVGNDFTHEGTFIDDEGNLWLGTLFGITKYNPNADKPITTPPKIYLTGIKLFNNDFPLNRFFNKPIFNYNENFIKFIYTGINLSAPEKTKYKYRLIGVDKDWVETTENSAPYTNLDDGNYTFEVKAGNEWGFWSNPVSASFSITPAWWETWWFYTIIVFAVASLISLVVSYRYKHLLAVEKIRTKISSDLHDSIGSGLTEITFLSQLLKNRVKQDDVANNQAANITNISKKIITDMRDIVWLVNPSKDTLKDLFYRLKDAYHDITQYSDVSVRINNIEELEDIHLPMTFRQHIYLIFKEAINNSIKYSKCKNITVDISTKSKILEVILKDNGIGFDINAVKKGNGLNNMFERSKAINGKIEIISSKNKGTTIIFRKNFSKLKISEI